MRAGRSTTAAEVRSIADDMKVVEAKAIMPLIAALHGEIKIEC